MGVEGRDDILLIPAQVHDWEGGDGGAEKRLASKGGAGVGGSIPQREIRQRLGERRGSIPSPNGCEELLHSRLRHSVHSLAKGRSRHSDAARCNSEGGSR